VSGFCFGRLRIQGAYVLGAVLADMYEHRDHATALSDGNLNPIDTN
jgi:hypothetical protein